MHSFPGATRLLVPAVHAEKTPNLPKGAKWENKGKHVSRGIEPIETKTHFFPPASPKATGSKVAATLQRQTRTHVFLATLRLGERRDKKGMYEKGNKKN